MAEEELGFLSRRPREEGGRLMPLKDNGVGEKEEIERRSSTSREEELPFALSKAAASEKVQVPREEEEGPAIMKQANEPGHDESTEEDEEKAAAAAPEQDEESTNKEAAVKEEEESEGKATAVVEAPAAKVGPAEEGAAAEEAGAVGAAAEEAAAVEGGGPEVVAQQEQEEAEDEQEVVPQDQQPQQMPVQQPVVAQPPVVMAPLVLPYQDKFEVGPMLVSAAGWVFARESRLEAGTAKLILEVAEELQGAAKATGRPIKKVDGKTSTLVKFLVEHAEDFKEVVERKQGHSKKLAQKYSKTLFQSIVPDGKDIISTFGWEEEEAPAPSSTTSKTKSKRKR